LRGQIKPGIARYVVGSYPEGTPPDHRKSVPGVSNGTQVTDRYPFGLGEIVVGTATSCMESGASAIVKEVGVPLLRIVTVQLRVLTESFRAISNDR